MQLSNVDLNESLNVKLTWADGTPLFHRQLPAYGSQIIEGSVSLVETDDDDSGS